MSYLNVFSDSLYLFDSFHQRLSTFAVDSGSSTYHFTESSSINVKSSPKIEGVANKHVDKTFVFNDGEMVVGMADPPVPNNSEREVFYYRLNTEGKLVQQKRLFEQNAISIFKTKANSFSVTMQLPFAPRPLVAVSRRWYDFQSMVRGF
ncbi:MAG: hypothetical protein U5J63_04495 [Fodinibius sp.]|nr:hypothetical protein [Fodinibius sp.]